MTSNSDTQGEKIGKGLVEMMLKSIVRCLIDKTDLHENQIELIESVLCEVDEQEDAQAERSIGDPSHELESFMKAMRNASRNSQRELIEQWTMADVYAVTTEALSRYFIEEVK